MALGPRYYDPANRESGFAAAVGGLLGGFEMADEFRRRRKGEAQADEDRRRGADSTARKEAIDEYERGVSVDPRATATPSAAVPSGTVTPGGVGGGALPWVQPMPAPAIPGAQDIDLAPPSLPNAMNTVAPSTPAAAAVPSPQPTSPAQGIRARVGALLGRVADNARTGGYHGYTPPDYSVTRTGPSTREREQGQQNDAAAARQREQVAASREIAKGNNATAIRVAEIGAASRGDVASIRAAGMNDPRLKASMQAISGQIAETDRAIAALQKKSNGLEPSLVDNAAARERKLADQARIERQITQLQEQRTSLASQHANMLNAIAAGVPDLSGYLAPAQPYQDPNAFSDVQSGSSSTDQRSRLQSAYENAIARGADKKLAKARLDSLLKALPP